MYREIVSYVDRDIRDINFYSEQILQWYRATIYWWYKIVNEYWLLCTKLVVRQENNIAMGCSQGFSWELKLGGYRQATIWAGGGNTDPESQGLVMDGAAD